MANIRECLACEQSFDPADFMLQEVAAEFKDQYCSKSCQDSYERYLLDAAVQMEVSNVNARPAQSNSGIDALIAQFRKKEQR